LSLVLLGTPLTITKIPKTNWEKKVPIIILFLILALLTACDSANETTIKIAGDKQAAAALSIARANGCMNCHNVNNSIIGPAWSLVSERYKDSPDAKEYLIDKIKHGGDGAWNNITGGAKMPAHESRVSHAHIEQIVDFILTLKK